MELNAKKIISLFLAKLKYILTAAIICSILSFFVTSLFIPKKYVASAKFLVVMDDEVSKATEASFVKEATNSYIEIFNTVKFFDEVADVYNTKYTYKKYNGKKIKEMTEITRTSSKDVPTFGIDVTTYDAQTSYAIAKTAAEHIKQKSELYTALNNIDIIDEPVLPTSPKSPSVRNNTILGFFLGGALVFVFFICKDILDNKIKGVEDITSSFKVNVLGSVPQVEIRKDKKEMVKGNELSEMITESIENAEHTDTNSYSDSIMFAVKEAYKAIRTNLILKLDEKPCHIITLASSASSEGKTTSAIALSIAIAQFDKKVLLIDADLRKKKASEYLGCLDDTGLTNVLIGEIKIEDAIKQTKYEKLDFLPSGITVTNPAERLAGISMNVLLENAQNDYDYIIIDTPPVNVVSDALPVIKMSDGVVIVARELAVSTDDFAKLMSNLKMINAEIFGIIYIGKLNSKSYYSERKIQLPFIIRKDNTNKEA